MTDLVMLRSILACKAITEGQRRAFQSMYDDLSNGKLIGLRKKQRAWAEEVYAKHRLDKLPPPSKPIPVKDKVKPTLNLGPLPLKPPGRR